MLAVFENAAKKATATALLFGCDGKQAGSQLNSTVYEAYAPVCGVSVSHARSFAIGEEPHHQEDTDIAGSNASCC